MTEPIIDYKTEFKRVLARALERYTPPAGLGSDRLAWISALADEVTTVAKHWDAWIEWWDDHEGHRGPKGYEDTYSHELADPLTRIISLALHPPVDEALQPNTTRVGYAYNSILVAWAAVLLGDALEPAPADRVSPHELAGHVLLMRLGTLIEKTLIFSDPADPSGKGVTPEDREIILWMIADKEIVGYAQHLAMIATAMLVAVENAYENYHLNRGLIRELEEERR